MHINILAIPGLPLQQCLSLNKLSFEIFLEKLVEHILTCSAHNLFLIIVVAVLLIFCFLPNKVPGLEPG